MWLGERLFHFVQGVINDFTNACTKRWPAAGLENKRPGGSLSQGVEDNPVASEEFPVGSLGERWRRLQRETRRHTARDITITQEDPK